MELMSSLLLCALAALLPQALGVKSNFLSEVKRDVPKVIEAPLLKKTVWLRRKIPTEVTIRMVLQYLRNTEECALCIDCINNALHTLTAGTTKTTEASAQHMQSRDFILNDIIENYHQYKVVRSKRSTANRIPTKVKRNQVSVIKNSTVTKYSMDGLLYAIKLKERNERNSTKELQQGEQCQVYSVKKYYPCESPDADLIFRSAKRKAIRRSKKQARDMLLFSTDKPQLSESSPNRASRDKVLAEPFITSIEELYT